MDFEDFPEDLRAGLRALANDPNLSVARATNTMRNFKIEPLIRRHTALMRRLTELRLSQASISGIFVRCGIPKDKVSRGTLSKALTRAGVSRLRIVAQPQLPNSEFAEVVTEVANATDAPNSENKSKIHADNTDEAKSVISLDLQVNVSNNDGYENDTPELRIESIIKLAKLLAANVSRNRIKADD